MKKGLRYLLGTKSGKLPGFVPMLWEMLNSKAYKELSYSTKAALIHFLGKPKPANIVKREYYEVEFSFTYSEAKNMVFPRKPFLQQLSSWLKKDLLTQ